MSREIEVFGQIMFCKNGTKEQFMEIISRLDLTPPVIIKPNWSTSTIFTEATILDWTLSALNCETVIVESYAFYRSPILKEHDGPFDDALEKKLTAQKKGDLRENDRWFLELTGIREILSKHDVEYLNLSEELWSKRVCEPKQIREIVDSRFEPLVSDILYSMIPTRLYDMRGGTLLSLAKPKISYGAIGVSLSIKNQFGMIATPYRGKFHGVNDSKLNDSIMDINKINQSLFSVRGIVEGVFTTSGSRDFLGKSTMCRDLGLVWGSNDVVELDATITTQLGLEAHEIGHLALASQTFGQWSQDTIKAAKSNLVTLR
ncbi:MAG: DUF362 domain-containing protein [Candidatus Thorarchaeota archaeon]